MPSYCPLCLVRSTVDILKPPLWFHRCKMWHLAGWDLAHCTSLHSDQCVQHVMCDSAQCMSCCAVLAHQHQRLSLTFSDVTESEGMLLQQTGKGFLPACRTLWHHGERIQQQAPLQHHPLTWAVLTMTKTASHTVQPARQTVIETVIGSFWEVIANVDEVG